MHRLHWLDRVLWLLVSWLLPGAGRPGHLDGVPLGDEGRIGPDWPHRYADSVGLALRLAPRGGLIADLAALSGPGVDVSRIHPLVRAFYEHTARFRLQVQPTWSALFWPGAALFTRLWPRRWGQLELPLGDRADLTNEIWSLGDAATLWVRRFRDATGRDTERALYVSRYDVVDVNGEPDRCVRISFPVPGGAWVVVLRVVLQDDAVVLTERGGGPGGPGLYLVPRVGPARYLAALREEIVVRPAPRGASAEHHFRWWGIRFLTLRYALPGSESDAAGTAK